MNFIDWIGTNWPQVITLVTVLLGGVGIIAKWTPTPKDDEWVAKILGWLNLLPVTAKERLAQLEAEKKANT